MICFDKSGKRWGLDSDFINSFFIYYFQIFWWIADVHYRYGTALYLYPIVPVCRCGILLYSGYWAYIYFYARLWFWFFYWWYRTARYFPFFILGALTARFRALICTGTSQSLRTFFFLPGTVLCIFVIKARFMSHHYKRYLTKPCPIGRNGEPDEGQPTLLGRQVSPVFFSYLKMFSAF